MGLGQYFELAMHKKEGIETTLMNDLGTSINMQWKSTSIPVQANVVVGAVHDTFMGSSECYEGKFERSTQPKSVDHITKTKVNCMFTR